MMRSAKSYIKHKRFFEKTQSTWSIPHQDGWMHYLLKVRTAKRQIDFNNEPNESGSVTYQKQLN